MYPPESVKLANLEPIQSNELEWIINWWICLMRWFQKASLAKWNDESFGCTKSKCQPGRIKWRSRYYFVAVMNPLAVPSPIASLWEWWSWWLHQVRAESERQLIEAVSDSYLSFSLGYLSFSFGSVFLASVLDPSSLLLLWWVNISYLSKSYWRIKCFRVQPIFEISQQLGMEPQVLLHLFIMSLKLFSGCILYSRHHASANHQLHSPRELSQALITATAGLHIKP